MKKRVLCMVLAVVMLFSLSVSAFAAQSDVSIVIDNKEVEFTASSGDPFVDENGRTQVPLRMVMEQFGCKVEWSSANNAAVITKGDTTVIVPIGKSFIIVNGSVVPMDSAALVQNGRTYLPIRAVLEAFCAEVEWDNGTVFVTSPASSEFDNIYIDEDGNLIFELANGNKINAGSVFDGKDGKDGRNGSDGVSVVNAYVDGSGNLIIVLSSGRAINAGNVGVGGSMSGLTFADYSVGTKFYLTQPTGAFDVTVNVGNTPYVVEFDSVYYELTAKNSYNDTNAWIYKNGSTAFSPYEATMFIEGQTDTALAGKTVNIVFSPSDDAVGWSYNAVIDTDGSFSVIFTQGDNNTTPWYAPKTLFLRSVSISSNSSTPSQPSTPEPDEEDLAIAALLAKVAGTWSIPSDAEKTFTLSADGTITYDGTSYVPTYMMNGESFWADISGCTDVRKIMFNSDEASARVSGGSSGYYYKDGTWEAVTLTKDNFFTYYEREETFEIEYNDFGEYESAEIWCNYVLKDEYVAKLVSEEYNQANGSTAAVKIQLERYRMAYTIDFENETYSVVEPGELISSDTYVRNDDLGFEKFMLTNTSLYPNNETVRFPKVTFIDATGTLYLIKNS